MFYVYEWFIVETNEIIYVGKGSKNRYKQITHRNKMFQEFLKRFNCESRIIEYFDDENEAFIAEHQRILELKNIGQAVCNLDYGGKGGCNFVWTDEMREYKSQYNPMKAEKQRERMRTNNPMKNAQTAETVRRKRQKPVIIDGVWYEGVKSCAKVLGVTETTVSAWCKRGYNTDGKPCRYADEKQKQYSITKWLYPKVSAPKAVIIDGIRFETVHDGAKHINVWSESLIRAIKENRLCKGHKVGYDNQQPSLTNFDNSSEEGSTTNG